MEQLPVYPSPLRLTNQSYVTITADQYRKEAYAEVSDISRSKHGQFFTPPPVARMMASLLGPLPSKIRLLDAGAGVGALTAAFVDELITRAERPTEINVVAYEQEIRFQPYLKETMAKCRAACEQVGVAFTSDIKVKDFVDAGSAMLRPRLLDGAPQQFNCAILNPPYKKIHSKSAYRQRLREAGIETVNLYTAFLALTAGMLEPDGQLVAITPRSFCNGPYYKSFRQFFDAQMAFRHIHLFESREKTFTEDKVLQENIIFHAVKTPERSLVTITSSQGPQTKVQVKRTVSYARVIKPQDPQLFIHITASELDQNIADRMAKFSDTLTDLGLDVSTGRVVDFRVKTYLRDQPGDKSVPLIYPHHMQNGFIRWPDNNHRKPNALVDCRDTRKKLLPPGAYVIVRRFSSKEEVKRVNAAIYDSTLIGDTAVAFENHVNVFHAWNKGITPELARGLTLYLNSTLVDEYFRQFNGHTQVNATDLRALSYPHREILTRWGQSYQDHFPEQQIIDTLIETELQNMSDLETPDPVAAKRQVNETINVLKLLGMPPAQQNERSAMTLLALLDLPPDQPWSSIGRPMLGITPIMNFIREHYGVDYAPNTRETIRRQSVHQFIQAALVVENPDDPNRPINSPKWCYQIEPSVFELLRHYGSDSWDNLLEAYLATAVTLKERYARQRELNLVPVKVAPDQKITLSAGKHSTLIKQIIEEFAPRFVPGGQLIYVGDTGDKWGYFDKALLDSLGVKVERHGKMPDVVIYHPANGWFILVEAVTSHGPVNPKRRIELEDLFAEVRSQLVFVTAFPTKEELARYIGDISWETEVWVADNPTHLIHFDGVRFLGPYHQEGNS